MMYKLTEMATGSSELSLIVERLNCKKRQFYLYSFSNGMRLIMKYLKTKTVFVFQFFIIVEVAIV